MMKNSSLKWIYNSGRILVSSTRGNLLEQKVSEYLALVGRVQVSKMPPTYSFQAFVTRVGELQDTRVD